MNFMSVYLSKEAFPGASRIEESFPKQGYKLLSLQTPAFDLVWTFAICSTEPVGLTRFWTQTTWQTLAKLQRDNMESPDTGLVITEYLQICAYRKFCLHVIYLVKYNNTTQAERVDEKIHLQSSSTACWVMHFYLGHLQSHWSQSHPQWRASGSSGDLQRHDDGESWLLRLHLQPHDSQRINIYIPLPLIGLLYVPWCFLFKT